jgi:hypothetical protein
MIGLLRGSGEAVDRRIGTRGFERVGHGFAHAAGSADHDCAGCWFGAAHAPAMILAITTSNATR